MAQKISTLSEALVSAGDKTAVDLGYIPIVVSLNGQLINKKLQLVNYWSFILQAKVAEECEKHRSIYNFGGTTEGEGGSSGSGESSGGSTPSGGGASSADLDALTSRVVTLETFRDTTAPATYFLKSYGDSLSGDYTNFKNTLQSTNQSVLTTLTSYDTRISSLETKSQNKLIIKVVDREGNLVRGFSYSPDEGLNSNVIQFPEGGYILLRTDELAQAMYHLELATAVTAVYSVENLRYAITIGPLQITTPTSGITLYTGGSITDAYIDITPSWDTTSTVHLNLSLGQNIVGTYNFTWYYPSNTDQLTGSNSFTILIKIGNWALTFNLTNNMTITGNISTDITAAL